MAERPAFCIGLPRPVVRKIHQKIFSIHTQSKCVKTHLKIDKKCYNNFEKAKTPSQGGNEMFICPNFRFVMFRTGYAASIWSGIKF